MKGPNTEGQCFGPHPVASILSANADGIGVVVDHVRGYQNGSCALYKFQHFRCRRCRAPALARGVWGAGRVGDWRAGLGRSLCSPLTRSFVCECHIISTTPRFQWIGAEMAQHEPMARIEARYRNEWPRKCHKRCLMRQNERGMFCGSSGRCGNPDFGAPSADARRQLGQLATPDQSVLNINFASCCPIESQGSTETEILVAP
jgi:hypothetical protein